MRLSNLVLLGAVAALLVIVIWVGLPRHDDAALSGDVAAPNVARNTERSAFGTDTGRDRPGRQEDREGTRVIPGGVAPRGDGPGGSAPRGGAVRAEPPASVEGSEESGTRHRTPAERQPEDLAALEQMALHDGDLQRRLAAVALLGASDDPKAVPILSRALTDDDAEVRLAALYALGGFADEMPPGTVERALKDLSPDVRYAALAALAQVGGDAARSAIASALNDPDENVRSLAETLRSEQAR